MDLHADLTQRAVLDTRSLPWHASPMAGVKRRMLDRRGGEVARATSIVRYAPGSRFDRHVHGGGEEILVLEGTFCDEGCTILVKLQQMHPADQQRLVIDTSNSPWVPGLVPGLQVMPLHAFGSEHVALVRWAPGTCFSPMAILAARRSWCLMASSRTSTAPIPPAAGCAIHRAVCTAPGARRVARSGSRPVTCLAAWGWMVQTREAAAHGRLPLFTAIPSGWSGS
ncbi:MAG: hypothetical protein RLZZ336_451 [Cyanobacteriota bacterium]